MLARLGFEPVLSGASVATVVRDVLPIATYPSVASVMVQ
jgi:hypothetical protein